MAAKSWATTALVMGEDPAAASDDKDGGNASRSLGLWQHTFMYCTKAVTQQVIVFASSGTSTPARNFNAAKTKVVKAGTTSLRPPARYSMHGMCPRSTADSQWRCHHCHLICASSGGACT